MFQSSDKQKITRNIDAFDFYISIDTINNALTDSLTHLTFGNYYNQPINYLPDNLTHLTLGRSYNYSTIKIDKYDRYQNDIQKNIRVVYL